MSNFGCLGNYVQKEVKGLLYPKEVKWASEKKKSVIRVRNVTPYEQAQRGKTWVRRSPSDQKSSQQPLIKRHKSEYMLKMVRIE